MAHGGVKHLNSVGPPDGPPTIQISPSKIDHFPMSDVRKTCTICVIRHSWESVTRGKRWKNRSFFRERRISVGDG